MISHYVAPVCMLLLVLSTAHASELTDAIKSDYDAYLAPLFDHFHRNPELSVIEVETAARMAIELRDAGFDVTENNGTGLVPAVQMCL